MITSLLKTFLLSLPMSMGGLCNSGNSYVHNAYDRRNVATIKNDLDYNQTSVVNDSAYVFKHLQAPNLFTNIPSYVEDTWFSYLYAFDFYIYDDEGDTHEYHGLHIYRYNGNYMAYAFPTEISYQNQDAERFFYFRGETQALTIGESDSSFVFDSIFVRVANIDDNPTLDELDFYPGEYQLNNWSVFNYFFKTGLDTYTIDEDFNYNGLKHTSRDSFYVSDGRFAETNPIVNSIDLNIYNGYFLSNGYMFSKAYLKYNNVYGSYINDGNGVIHFSNANTISIGYYFGMFFTPIDLNDFGGNTPMIHERGWYIENPNTTSWHVVYNTDTIWLKPTFKTLEFLNNVDTQSDNFVSLHTQYNLNVKSEYYDAGLGNAFNLIRTCFGGFASLFAISLIPGMSIGLLLFLPLIMSIVVLVFKAVKK